MVMTQAQQCDGWIMDRIRLRTTVGFNEAKMKRNLKKTAVLLGGFIAFASALSCCSGEIDMSLYQRAKRAAADVSKSLSEEELQAMLVDLTGEDPSLARIAVCRFAELGATNLVVLALEYPASSVQIEAAKRLKGSKSKEVILAVLDALEVANNYLLKGGAEVILANKELKTLLIEIVCSATSCNPQDVSAEDCAATQKLIDVTRQYFSASK